MAVIFIIISLLLAMTYIGLIHFYVKGWLKTPNQNTRKIIKPSIGITVVVAVRNEEKNIEACISSILNQNFPKDLYEIIVVNDFSTDQTLQFLEKFNNKIQIVKLSEYLPAENALIPNKKKAISLAVDKAKHQVILCADGDCVYGENWILSMEQYYKKYQKQFVSGPVDYINDGKIFSNFLQMDLVAMIGVTAGSIGQKKPVMASGANMLFEKAAFLEVGGYEGNEEIASGDDVFLMQKIFLKNNKAVGFVKNIQAFAYTYAPQSFQEFLNQRIRWTSKSNNLVDNNVRLVLVLNYLFYIATFFSLFILPWWHLSYLAIGLILLALKLLIDLLFFGNVLAFYNKTYLLKWIVVMEILHLIYVSLLGVLAIFGTYKWKGRTIKK